MRDGIDRGLLSWYVAIQRWRLAGRRPFALWKQRVMLWMLWVVAVLLLWYILCGV